MSTLVLRFEVHRYFYIMEIRSIVQDRLQTLICQQNHQASTSDTGGWCESALWHRHMTDQHLVDALAKLFAGQTVVGLGDGRGVYRNLLLETGKIWTYDAFDGAPNIGNISHGQVHRLCLVWNFRVASLRLQPSDQKC